MCRLDLMLFAAALLTLPLVARFGSADYDGQHSDKLVEETDADYVDRILSKLNNSKECDLPSIQEVDEVHQIFAKWSTLATGDPDSNLTEDQRLFKRTILKDWQVFIANTAVMMLSPKKRMFISRVEAYQETKFGSSVCVDVKRKLGPLTDKVFVRNPLVRYLKHLDTGEVVEPPTKAEIEAEAKAKAALVAAARAEAAAAAAAKAKAEAEAKAKAEAEARAQAEEESRAMAEAELRAKAQAEAEAKSKAEAETEAKAETEAEAKAKTEARPRAEEESRAMAETELSAKAQAEAEAEDEAKAKAELEAKAMAELEVESSRLEAEKATSWERTEAGAQAKDVAEVGAEAAANEKAEAGSDLGLGAVDSESQIEVDIPGVKYTYMGEFTVELDETPSKLTITIEHDLDNQDDERDPLDEIPVPRIQEDEEKKSETRPVNRKGTFGDTQKANYFDADRDDADLDKLVDVPQLDWHHDTIYGFFKWPDECGQVRSTKKNACTRQLDESDFDEFLSLNGTWARFVKDPEAFDKELQKGKKKIRTHADRARVIQDRIDASRRERLFALNVDSRPPPIEWPTGVPKDRWLFIANNNYCKIGFNHGRMVYSTRSSYQAVKKFTKQAVISSRRRLLSN